MLTAIAISGALHAGLFVAGAGLDARLFAGLENVTRARLLTVSIAPAAAPPQAPASSQAAGTAAPRAATESPTPEGRPDMQHEGADATPARPPSTQPTRIRAKPRLSRRTADEPALETSDRSPTRLARSEPTNNTRTTERRRARGGQTLAHREPSKGEADADASSRHSAAAGDTGRQAERTYLSEFLEALSRYKHYPQSARLRGQEGTVIVALILRRDGAIDDVHVAEPSRFPLLNRAALRTVRQLDRFKPFPTDMHRGSWELTVPFQYAISDR
ncbi:MAG: energy transducer TonB [Arenicellales bacterium]